MARLVVAREERESRSLRPPPPLASTDSRLQALHLSAHRAAPRPTRPAHTRPRATPPPPPHLLELSFARARSPPAQHGHLVRRAPAHPTAQPCVSPLALPCARARAHAAPPARRRGPARPHRGHRSREQHADAPARPLARRAPQAPRRGLLGRARRRRQRLRVGDHHLWVRSLSLLLSSLCAWRSQKLIERPF